MVGGSTRVIATSLHYTKSFASQSSLYHKVVYAIDYYCFLARFSNHLSVGSSAHMNMNIITTHIGNASIISPLLVPICAGSCSRSSVYLPISVLGCRGPGLYG